MFTNIERKIKVLAKVFGVFGIIAAIAGIVMVIGGLSTAPEIIIVGISAAAAGISMLLSSWLVYGFGQLVEDVHKMSNK